MPRPFAPPRSLASSWATTAVLVASAVALWAFILTAPREPGPHSNTLVLRAAPTVGDHHASVQLVYFYRPDCAYCTEMAPLVRRLVRENAGGVYAQFVQVTVDGSADGPVAGICAERSMGRPAFEHSYCLGDGSLRADVESDLALAERLGVEEVPTILIGTNRVVGAASYATLDSLLRATVGSL